MTQEEFNNIVGILTDNVVFNTKAVLTATETARYLGISKSYLYKLTMRGAIPHYKPMGKMCYFDRAEVEAWLHTNRAATATEIADRANKMTMGKGAAR